MKRWRLWAGAVLGYGLVLLYTAPATLLDAALAARTEGRVRLTQAQGTVWSGQGRIEVRDTDVTSVFTRELHWQLDGSRVLFAELIWRLTDTADAPAGGVSAGWSTLALTQLDLTLPVAAVAQAWPAVAGYGLGGELQLHIASLNFGAGATSGDATLQWRHASTTLAPLAPLGSYEVQLSGAGAALGINLHTLQGPLQLDGNATLTGGRLQAVTVVAQVAAAEYALLAPFLRLFAVENPDGSFVLHVD